MFAESQLFADAPTPVEPQLRLEPEASQFDGWRLHWVGEPGWTYFVQQSADLSSWDWMPVIRSGADGICEWTLPGQDSNFFLRLRSSDIPTNDPVGADFDDDGLANGEEVEIGLNPLSPTQRKGSSVMVKELSELGSGVRGVSPGH